MPGGDQPIGWGQRVSEVRPVRPVKFKRRGSPVSFGLRKPPNWVCRQGRTVGAAKTVSCMHVARVWTSPTDAALRQYRLAQGLAMLSGRENPALAPSELQVGGGGRSRADLGRNRWIQSPEC